MYGRELRSTFSIRSPSHDTVIVVVRLACKVLAVSFPVLYLVHSSSCPTLERVVVEIVDVNDASAPNLLATRMW